MCGPKMYHLQERSGVTWCIGSYIYWNFKLHTYLYPSTQLFYICFFFHHTDEVGGRERERERLFGTDVLVVCVKKTFILFMYMPYMCPLYLHTVKGGLATETSQKLDSAPKLRTATTNSLIHIKCRVRPLCFLDESGLCTYLLI